MMRSLRLRLTGLYALLSALVLAAALVAGALLEARDLRQAGDESLLDAAAAVADRLAGATTLADSWLAEQEQAYECLYYLEDNGVPLEHTEKNGSAALLTGEALDRCAALGAGQSAVFGFEAADGEVWRCAALALAPANLRHGPRLLLALRSTAPLNAQLAGVAVKYALLWAGGTALLAAAGALLAHIALRPTVAALRQQNEFVAAASHELRAPLTVIKSSLQAASEPDRRDKLLGIAGAEVERLQRLTEELLFLAGQDAHILRLCPEELEPDTFLLEVWEAWRAPLRQSGHELALDLPDEPFSPIRADKARLEQLFTILLHNAMEYTPPGTAIELAAERRGAGVIFSVRDHGPGVPEKDRQRIFRRFARGEECRTGKEHFGLGLSIARQIAALHGGRLWVEDAPGGGAVFFLQLPAGR